MDARQRTDDTALPEGESVQALDGVDRIVPGPERRSVARALVRSMLTIGGLVAAYYVLPLKRSFGPGTIATLVAVLVFLTVLVGLQVRSIVRSPYPALRAMESLALTIPLFLVIFAVVYEVLSTSDPHAFSQQLGRTDALYFVVTVFATVGFGDITAVSQVARVLVTLQMVCDLLLLGLVIRAMVTAVQRGHRNRSGGPR